MNATDFIKQHGVDKAREVIDGAPDKTASHYVISKRPHYYSVDFQSYFNNGDWYDSDYTSEQDLANDYEPQNVIRISDLKRLVDSVAIVESLGGIDQAKLYISLNDNQHSIMLIYRMITSDEIKQAIANYELIYSNDMGDDTHIENHVSPNCKVGVK